jgi:hypothetical protein
MRGNDNRGRKFVILSVAKNPGVTGILSTASEDLAPSLGFFVVNLLRITVVDSPRLQTDPLPVCQWPLKLLHPSWILACARMTLNFGNN